MTLKIYCRINSNNIFHIHTHTCTHLETIFDIFITFLLVHRDMLLMWFVENYLYDNKNNNNVLLTFRYYLLTLLTKDKTIYY